MNKIALMAATAALVVATPAVAAPVPADPVDQAHATILIPLTLSKLEDLHFGTIIPATVSGTVTVPANGNPPTTTGGVTLVASDPTMRARFGGAGTANQNVFINVTNPGTLSNGLGDTVTVGSSDGCCELAALRLCRINRPAASMRMTAIEPKRSFLPRAAA